MSGGYSLFLGIAIEMALFIYTATLPYYGPVVIENGIPISEFALLTQVAIFISLFTNAWTTVIIGQKAWSVGSTPSL